VGLFKIHAIMQKVHNAMIYNIFCTVNIFPNHEVQYLFCLFYIMISIHNISVSQLYYCVYRGYLISGNVISVISHRVI